MQEKSTESTQLQRRREAKLVRQLLSGDQRAFREFVDNYFPRLYRYARSRLGNEQAVDDVVQATLSAAAQNLATFRGEASLYTWLIQICRHEISRHLKQSARDRDRMVPFLNDELLNSSVELVESAPDLEPEFASQRAEVLNYVGVALDQLPEAQAMALDMKYIEGFSSQEISTRMGISDQAVQSLLARARRSFRSVYTELLQEPAGQSSSVPANMESLTNGQ